MNRTVSSQSSALVNTFFYRNEKNGHERVYEWLKKLHPDDRRILAAEIKTLEMSFAVGMPMARQLNDRLWVVKVQLDKRVARIVFHYRKSRIVLLSATARLRRRVEG